MLARFGRAMYRGRWVVVSFWLVLVAVSALFAPRVTDVLQGGGYTIGRSESEAAYNQLHRAYGYRALTFTVVLTASPADRRRLPDEAQRLRREVNRRFGQTLHARQPVWTPDRSTIFFRVYSSPQEDFGARFARPIRDMLPDGAV